MSSLMGQVIPVVPNSASASEVRSLPDPARHGADGDAPSMRQPVHKFTDLSTSALAGLAARPANPSDSSDMRPQVSRDPFDSPRDPITPWERSLRPPGPSGWRAGGSAVLCVLAAAWIATRYYVPPKVGERPEVAAPAPASAKAVSSRPSAVVAPQETKLPQRLVKCIGPQGVAGYTDGACPAGSKAAAVTELPGLTVADGMRQEDREAVQQANRIAARQKLAHEMRVAQNVDRTSDECGLLNAAVAAYDAEARQPLSGWRQDRLREMRKAARDRQFALRCS